MLQSGTVHYVTPQLSTQNLEILNDIEKKGFERISVDQLGYGYIGINASYVKNIYLRRAIMSAMDTSLAIAYYQTGTAEPIYWPMSTVSWAYPKDEDGNNETSNGHDYPVKSFTEEKALNAIKDNMSKAKDHTMGYSDSDLKITFTIAGSNLTDHPTYQVFQTAAMLLNKCGWQVEVVADSQALTKLSTGSLAVWAAAWGTTVDPDMYQVYHKNSNASSVKAWGYNAILSNPTSYHMEYDILTELSEVIDDARETDDREVRTALYEEAMGYVLDLAVELPVYQRQQLYAYNAKILDPTSFPQDLNPYSTPLDRLWEIKFNEGVGGSDGSKGNGGIIAGGIGAALIVAAVVVFFTLPEKKRLAILGIKRPYVIPVDDIDEEDMKDYNLLYKKNRR
jgi:peptide/nickel transport system substrate-binding protein